MENVAYQRGSSGRTFQGSVTREKTGWKSGGQCAEWQRCELWPRLPVPRQEGCLSARCSLSSSAAALPGRRQSRPRRSPYVVCYIQTCFD
jgi:hypothetical protein